MLMIPLVIMTIDSDGDRAVMTDIYLRHRGLMLKIARQYTGEPAEMEDVVSDSCVALIQHLEALKGLEPEGQRAYIVSTVRHKAIDLCRKKAREQGKGLPVDTEMEAPAAFEHRIVVQEEIDMVKQAVRSLPSREREALTMKFFEHKSDREIADSLGVSESTVRKYIMQGRSHIKAALYAQEDQE